MWKIRYILLIILLLILSVVMLLPLLFHSRTNRSGSYLNPVVTEQQGEVLQPDELERYQ